MCTRVDLEAMLKKQTSRILTLAEKGNLTVAPRARQSTDFGTANLDFVNVVKLSEEDSPQFEQPEALIT